MARVRFIIKDILAPLRRLLKKMNERDVMIILSLFVGVSCGLAAVTLKSAILFIHHGLTSWFDAEVFTLLNFSSAKLISSIRCAKPL